MFPTDKSKQFPFLSTYLNHLGRRRAVTISVAPLSLWVGLVAAEAGILFVPSALHLSWLANLILTIAATASVCAVGAHVYNKTKHVPTPEEERALLARNVGKGLQEMIRLRRLHRDLDPASLAVLEECARFWARASQAFESPYWTSEYLPIEYRVVRDQALVAVETSMADVMILYQNHVPENVSGRAPMDYVEEALETYVFKKPTTFTAPPAAFGPAREIAEKLRALAEEAERVSLEVASDPTIFAQAKPGRALDVTLGELRQIREAEAELRQHIGGALDGR